MMSLVDDKVKKKQDAKLWLKKKTQSQRDLLE